MYDLVMRLLLLSLSLSGLVLLVLVLNVIFEAVRRRLHLAMRKRSMTVPRVKAKKLYFS